MEGKKSFVLYCDMGTTFDALPDEIAGRLIKIIFDYVRDKNPEPNDLILKVAFEPIKMQLKRDLQTWMTFKEKQSLNGKRGGRPKKAKESQKTQAFSNKPKIADNVNDIDSVNVFTFELLKREFSKTYTLIMITDFYNYWSEKGENGKSRCEMEKTWETSKRLHSWSRRNFNGTKQPKQADFKFKNEPINPNQL